MQITSMSTYRPTISTGSEPVRTAGSRSSLSGSAVKDAFVKGAKFVAEAITPQSIQKIARGEKLTKSEMLETAGYVALAAGLSLSVVGLPIVAAQVSYITAAGCFTGSSKHAQNFARDLGHKIAGKFRHN